MMLKLDEWLNCWKRLKAATFQPLRKFLRMLLLVSEYLPGLVNFLITGVLSNKTNKKRRGGGGGAGVVE